MNRQIEEVPQHYRADSAATFAHAVSNEPNESNQKPAAALKKVPRALKKPQKGTPSSAAPPYAIFRHPAKQLKPQTTVAARQSPRKNEPTAKLVYPRPSAKLPGFSGPADLHSPIANDLFPRTRR